MKSYQVASRIIFLFSSFKYGKELEVDLFSSFKNMLGGHNPFLST